MASIFLSPPGTKYGPCEGKCAHTDCALTRKQAAEKCDWCNEAIGYDRNFYTVDGEPVHADCYQKQLESIDPGP